MANPTLSLKTGNLRLKLHRKDDIFHAEDVSNSDVLPVYENLINIPTIGFGQGTFYRSGFKSETMAVELSKHDTIINGFYEDTIPQNEFATYEVNIYISYELEA